jgi:hypothetical protein
MLLKDKKKRDKGKIMEAQKPLILLNVMASG